MTGTVTRLMEGYGIVSVSIVILPDIRQMDDVPCRGVIRLVRQFDFQTDVLTADIIMEKKDFLGDTEWQRKQMGRSQ